jgi:hypothetical protein
LDCFDSLGSYLNAVRAYMPKAQHKSVLGVAQVMGENLADALSKTANVLHWLGKYDSANALILLSRLLRAHKIENLDDFEKFVVAAEGA